ncbi:MAG: MaoC family dehydratase N-terminal domain-containing protein [Acidobacteria bacterium]|nr:MaoC family dehydratase N-terminal domain-containing protein [Acidobacteriota bacterium]
MSENSSSGLYEELRAMVGLSGNPRVARDPVNVPTTRNWCDAMSEANPNFTDSDMAATGPHGGLVAPPATLNVWTMSGLTMGQQPPRDMAEPSAVVYSKLDAAGYSSVVATNSDQVYHRYLRPGDLITSVTTLVDVSEEKTTALGVGYFVTTEAAFTDQHGESVGSLFFRVLKFKPGTGRTRESKPDPKRDALIEAGLDPDEFFPPEPRPARPRPQWNEDQAWHWEGLRERELRIQRFTDDGTLVHPPANANPNTQSMDYDYVVASGRGTLYSYTVPQYPQVPAFDYPLVVGLVELEEGVRVVSNIIDVPADQLEIGMPLEVCYIDTHDDVTLHQFRPATAPRNETTLCAADVAVGDRLPLCPIPLDHRLIISTALATRDFQDVHHDVAAAKAKGSKDIFMNILTTSGLCNRWVGDWAGPDAMFSKLEVGLGAPNYPGDTMTLSGAVTAVADDGTITVGFKGANSLGNHVTGSVEIVLPDRSAAIGEGS